MIIKFSVGNYLSFNDIVTLCLVAAKIKSRNKKLNEENLFSISGLNLLKSAAIYGANASGKSNLLKAIGFMKDFIITSSKETQAEEPIEVENFKLSTETEKKPSFFEIIFLIDGQRYRYGFTVDSKKVHSEWLYHVPKSREARLFLREESKIIISNVFKEGRGLTSKTRENALFLSVVAQFNGPISINIFKWFRGLGFISGLSDAGYRQYTIERIETDKEYRDNIVSFVRRMDVGISNIVIREIELTDEEIKAFRYILKYIKEVSDEEVSIPESKYDVFSIHKKFDKNNFPISEVEFDIDVQESEGTQKLLYLLGPIVTTLLNGRTIVIDEMDARLHPLITCSLIQLFCSNKTNPKNAQLVFATHDTNLLSNKLFRRDQIWFTEKNRYGATDLYSLAEIKVRNDASFERDYISGKYGAIPFLGDIEYILGGENE